MRAILGVLLLLAALLPATASAGYGWCPGDEAANVCVGDQQHGDETCEGERSTRYTGVAVETPGETRLYVFGFEDCGSDGAYGPWHQQGVLVYGWIEAGPGVPIPVLVWYEWSDGPASGCSFWPGSTWDCPAGAPPNPGWGDLVP